MVFDGPRLRRDLVSTILREDGVKCVDVHDPKRGASFRLFDYEYSVALAFDGRPLAKVIPWVRLSTGLELTAEQLTAFAARLDQLGFLESEMARTPGVAPERTPAVPQSDEEAETPSPVPSQPVLAETPLPVPPQPAPVGDETPAPLAAQSPLAAAEQAVEPPQAEAACKDTPSPDASAAAETPAVVVTTAQPDGPSQHQPWLPATDATPAPNDSPAPPASASEPASVSPDRQPATVVDQTPPLPSREETPSPMPEPRPARHMSDGEAAEITSHAHSLGHPVAHAARAGARRPLDSLRSARHPDGRGRWCARGASGAAIAPTRCRAGARSHRQTHGRLALVRQQRAGGGTASPGAELPGGREGDSARLPGNRAADR